MAGVLGPFNLTARWKLCGAFHLQIQIAERPVARSVGEESMAELRRELTDHDREILRASFR